MPVRQNVKTTSAVLLLAGAAAGCLGGCASAPPTRTARMTEIGVQQTTAEMRVHLREYLRSFSGAIESAADGVLVSENDLAIQQSALLLKANGVTTMQAAVFQRDPLAALADAWTLTAAMSRFFEDGKGKALFGGSQPQVVETLHTLEGLIDTLVQGTVDKEHMNALRPEINRFLADNPIRDLSFGLPSAGLRPSVLAAAAWSTDALRSVTRIDETAYDIAERLTIYAEQLPKIARWQGEIVLIEARREVLAKPLANLDGIDTTIGGLGKDVNTVTAFVTGTPDLIAAERALVLETLAQERATILSSVDQQRVATLAALTVEREAILAAVEELRRATVTDLGTETARSLDRIDKLSTARVQELSRVSSDAIDHLFWRALELLLVGMRGVRGPRGRTASSETTAEILTVSRRRRCRARTPPPRGGDDGGAVRTRTCRSPPGTGRNPTARPGCCRGRSPGSSRSAAGTRTTDRETRARRPAEDPADAVSNRRVGPYSP